MFVEIVVVEERQRAEALSDALLDAGALSASIEDADAGGPDEDAIYGEPGGDPATAGRALGWKRSRVVALFDENADIDRVLRDAFAAAGVDDAPVVERRSVADADWVRLTQAQFEPIAIGERLWIVPSWHALPDAARGPDRIVLRLDPGMAFGTGDHATTRLCLAWLAEHALDASSVIDYGCGSGILGIAAARLGALRVVGTDIDDQAVTAARDNARANAVDIAFESSATFAGEPADVVVANILSNPLKVLAPLLTSLVRPEGTLVLSGILERQWTEVAAVYAPAIVLSLWREDSGWVCLTGRRAH